MSTLTAEQRQQAVAASLAVAALIRPIASAPVRREVLRRAAWMTGDEGILAPEVATNGHEAPDDAPSA